MIIRSTPLGSPWKRGAVAFSLTNFLSVFFACVVLNASLDINGTAASLIILVALISVAMLFCDKFFAVHRLKYVAAILGVSVAMPIFIFSLNFFFLFIYLAKLKPQMISWAVCFYFIALFFCGVYSAKKTLRLERRYDYLSKEIIIDDSRGYFDAEKSNDLEDACTVTSKNFLDENSARVIKVSLVLSSILYLCAKNMGGIMGALALLAVMSTPLSLYFSGRIASGFVLWIYLIGNFEKRHGIKIFLKQV